MREFNISNRAHKEIKRLFSQRMLINTLHTDPEVTETIDNFLYDETLAKYDGVMSERTRVMCILASTLGCNSMNEFKQYVEAGLNVGIKPREIREIVYQAYPYMGVSQVVEYNLVLNDLFENNFIRLPLDDQRTIEPDCNALEEAGSQLYEQAHGEGAAARLTDSFPESQKHIAHYILAHCYGQYYTRNGIDLRHREFITIAFLAAMGCNMKLLKIHVEANKNLKATKQELESIVTTILPWIGLPKALNAFEIVNEVYG
ncbi:MAG: carboxymuconolactone decarboxylase family protein [Bacteroidaceae bacterium]|nr:carboxymuconolactone decarboxylase family protein [Bacteroidaceae bacterium]